MNEVKLIQENPMLIKIVTEDYAYLKEIKELFTCYVDGFQYMPQYRSGSWNGKTCMIHGLNNTLPYGLLFDFIKKHKRYFPRHILTLDEKVKNLFIGPKIKPRYDLSLYPRKYQKECIRACLDYTKGIIRSSTASGKSLVISYVVRIILNSKKSNVNNCVIIVPSISLVEQFYGDMIEYGIDGEIIGRVGGKRKEWGNVITISTWQSLKNNHDILKDFDCVIVDETHQSKAYQIKKILVKSVRAKYRLGFTGTLHMSELDNWNTKAYIGPVLKDYPSGLLADQGFISRCNIEILHLEYMNERIEGTYDGDYNDVKDEVFNNPFRMELIENIVKKLDHNVLLLVGKVESEGEILERHLKENTETDVVFLSGRDSADVREKWRKKMMNSNDKKKIILLKFGDNNIEIDCDYLVPLSNGENKKASDITINDDIDDLWIEKRI